MEKEDEMLRMQGGYELASMPLRKSRSSMAASMGPLPIKCGDRIDNNLDSVIDVEEMSQAVS